MALITLIYVSSATKTVKDSDIVDILKASREANGKVDITGILLFKDGNFMQVLEGEAAVVDALHGKISKDPRHTGLITLLRKPITERSFSNWKMGFKDMGGLTPAEKSGHSDSTNIAPCPCYRTRPGKGDTARTKEREAVLRIM